MKKDEPFNYDWFLPLAVAKMANFPRFSRIRIADSLQSECDLAPHQYPEHVKQAFEKAKIALSVVANVSWKDTIRQPDVVVDKYTPNFYEIYVQKMRLRTKKLKLREPAENHSCKF